MQDSALQAAISNWEPRVIANGVDPNDYRRIVGDVERWADWLPAWAAHGDTLAELAAEAEQLGRRETAGELWRRAASSYHFGKFVWIVDLQLHEQATRKAAAALAQALRLLDPSSRRLEIPFDGAKLFATYRRPAGAADVPLVLIIAGLDSTKEEFFGTEELFHRRGLATVTLDGPGQGEAGLRLPIRHDFDVPVAAVLDFVAADREISHPRIGAVGFSLGGYYVARAAAFEPRIEAAVGISGPYDFSANWDRMPQLTRETFAHASGAADEPAARAAVSAFNLDGVAERIEQPLLVITGDQDRIVPWQQTKRIADEARNATWRLYAGGNHVVNNMPYSYKTLTADWLRERLVA
jgi:2,6-dihydroxypseudooxynicotine hydrolase